MIPTLRVIGDVHGQVDAENLFTRDAPTYLEIISDAQYSVQVGDMGDAETYAQLISSVDAARHRFVPGNHEAYDRLPPHSLGDFGAVSLGGVDFFFVRGAWSSDRETLLRLGQEAGRPVWFPEEELTNEKMHAAEQEYSRVRPHIMLSHDAPTSIARLAWQHARRLSPPNSRAVFSPSRTTDLLQRFLELHRPRLWLFGHYHRNWRYRQGETHFVCVGELTYCDITRDGNVR